MNLQRNPHRYHPKVDTSHKMELKNDAKPGLA